MYIIHNFLIFANCNKLFRFCNKLYVSFAITNSSFVGIIWNFVLEIFYLFLYFLFLLLYVFYIINSIPINSKPLQTFSLIKSEFSPIPAVKQMHQLHPLIQHMNIDIFLILPHNISIVILDLYSII